MEFIFEVFGWIRIVLSPLILASGIGAAVYFSNPNGFTLSIAITLSVLGLIIGIIWATRTWKKHGTMQFLSRIDATPDIDEWIEKESKKNK
jgi:hypothetical protein